MMQKTELLDKIRDIEGFLFDNEAYLLYTLAKACTGKGSIVEIGSWKGKSTVCLGLGSREGNKIPVYAVDPHTGSSEHQKKDWPVWTFDVFQENIRYAGISSVVHPLVKTSEEAAREFHGPIEVLFIDGAHEYEAVKKDFELWFPNVVEGGYVAMHDVSDVWEGPQRVAKEMMLKSGRFKNIRMIDSITYGQKAKENSLLQRVVYSSYVFFDDSRRKKPKSMQAIISTMVWRKIKKIINIL